MKNITEVLADYKSVHFNKTNMMTHFIGIPLIIWAVTLLLSLHVFHIELFNISILLTPAYVFFICSLVYYFMLHIKLAIGMTLYVALNLYLVSFVTAHPSALYIAVIVFVIGWVFQFVGHYYEKAKPAFFDDLGNFLIGPLFLLAEVYFLLGWENKLEERITPVAISKRKALSHS
jgi:uncharacterized membrane protein YGL010W